MGALGVPEELALMQSVNNSSLFPLRCCYMRCALTLTCSEQALFPGCDFFLLMAEAGCSGVEKSYREPGSEGAVGMPMAGRLDLDDC